MKALLIGLLLTAAPDAGVHKHCWHATNHQHAIPLHVDEICCYCGETRCRELPHGRPPGHGKYAPEVFPTEVPL